MPKNIRDDLRVLAHGDKPKDGQRVTLILAIDAHWDGLMGRFAAKGYEFYPHDETNDPKYDMQLVGYLE